MQCVPLARLFSGRGFSGFPGLPKGVEGVEVVVGAGEFEALDELILGGDLGVELAAFTGVGIDEELGTERLDGLFVMRELEAFIVVEKFVEITRLGSKFLFGYEVELGETLGDGFARDRFLVARENKIADFKQGVVEIAVW